MLDLQLFIIIVLTFIIHLIGTLAYAFRIAGIRTGHIAIAFSLFNILVLVSRLSNSFQGPLLAKRVENAIQLPSAFDLTRDFSLILVSASLATLLGGLLIPTFQRFSAHAVESFQRKRSVPRLLIRSMSPTGLALAVRSFAVPSFQNLMVFKGPTGVPISIFVLNFFASALWTVGVLASIYAGILEPEFRVTASTLSSVINAVATIMMFVMIDPFLSGLTDDVVGGRKTDGYFRKIVVLMILSRFAGTIAAQFLLVPSAHLIVYIARII